MTIDELKRICQEQIDFGIGEPQIVLKQAGKWGKSSHRRLFGVKGEIVQDNFGDGLIVMYPDLQILAAISRK
jgi:hypothetical protein